jgi:hypothetical protein
MASSINASTTAGVVTTADTSGVLNIQTAGTTAITIDASQNVGQNGAASAWAGAGRYAYQINDTVVGYFASKTRGEFTCNYYYNGSVDSYIQNGYAGLYLIDSTTGNHTWYTAPNNTSGANATMTTTASMTLNNTGALALRGASTSANGVGITFPATQSASTDANTLDDYEEGTLTTTFSSPVNLTGTPALGKGRYTKVGRLVSIQGEVTGYSITTANTLTYFVMTLPFITVSNTEAFSGSVTETNSYSVGTILDSSSGSDNTIFLGFRAASVPSSGSATYHFSLTYMSA